MFYVIFNESKNIIDHTHSSSHTTENDVGLVDMYLYTNGCIRISFSDLKPSSDSFVQHWKCISTGISTVYVPILPTVTKVVVIPFSAGIMP